MVAGIKSEYRTDSRRNSGRFPVGMVAGFARNTQLSVIGMNTNAGATIISKDLYNSGDGYVTFDDSTGLSWLDLTLTQNQSYNSVMSGYGGYVAQGFRYATTAEVGNLIANAGVTQGNIWGWWDFSNQYYTTSAALSSLLGITYPYDGLWVGTLGITGSSVTTGSHEFAEIAVNSHADSYANQDIGGLEDYMSVSYIGSFLVKDTQANTPVPEPSTIFLLGAGLASVSFMRRRANK